MLSQQDTKHLDWKRFFIDDSKKAGFIGVTSSSENFKVKRWYGANDHERLADQTAGRQDQLLTINGFALESPNEFRRKNLNLKQIRNIAIDIDQYNVEMDHYEALTVIKEMIEDNKLPTPNLVLQSNGIQLFYSIKGGAAPAMSWLAEYITDQLIHKLKHLGADPNAKGMARLMRVPNSINSKNGTTVKPYIWREEEYTLQELQGYVKPLKDFTNRRTNRHNISFSDPKLIRYYKTNYARLRDLESLVEMRGGDMTGMRNVFFYMYAYHKALVLDNFNDVLEDCERLSHLIFTTAEDKRMRGFKTTIRSAYKDARAFFLFHQNNGYQMVYYHLDGIKRPYKTVNIIDKLAITSEEQRGLRSITSPEVKRKNETDHMRQKRRDNGTHKQTRAEYEAERALKKERLQAKVAELKAQGHVNAKIADMTGISKRQVIRLLGG